MSDAMMEGKPRNKKTKKCCQSSRNLQYHTVRGREVRR